MLLLFIFQNLDKENEILKEQLTTLRDEMEDATEKMNEMTEELSSAQVKTVEYKGIYIQIIYFLICILFNMYTMYSMYTFYVLNNFIFG